MTTSTALVATNQLQAEDDIFSHLQPISAFDVKKDYIATQLAALMSFCEKSRSDMAEGLGWEKSRITRILSGENNLTIKTIWEFSSYLGFDYDVVFHSADQRRPQQPWQIERREIVFSQFWNTLNQEINLPGILVTQAAYDITGNLLTENIRVGTTIEYEAKTNETASSFTPIQIPIGR
jgi:transcriptional regulator with XRE-family HTH domain